MVFLILIGAAVFSLVFRGFGGEELVEQFLLDCPGCCCGNIAGDVGDLFAWLYSGFY